MIQLGAVLAVVWLYRRKVWSVVVRAAAQRRGPPLRADGDRRLRAGAGRRGAVLRFRQAGALLQPGRHRRGLRGRRPGDAGRRAAPARRRRCTRWTTSRPAGPSASACARCWRWCPGCRGPGATIVGGMVMGLERRTAAEFSFFLSMPTMSAAFAHDLLEVRHALAPDRALAIAIGFVTAFLAALVVVGPFLRFVGRAGFAPFAWYRIVAGTAAARRRRRGLAVGTGDAVAAPQFHHRVLRHRAAHRERRGAGLGLPVRRRLRDPDRHPGAGPRPCPASACW